MLRKMMLAAVAVVVVTAGTASAQVVSVSVGGYGPRPYYRSYAAPVYVRPVVVQAPPVLVAPPPQVVVAPPPQVLVAAPVCAPVFAQQDFVLLHAARHFSNAMSAQGYEVRLASHGLGWRVYYGRSVR